MNYLKMKLLLLILIIGGSISCSLGVEPLESLASQRGGKEKTASQLAGKADPREDVKRNHMNMMEKLREYDC